MRRARRATIGAAIAAFDGDFLCAGTGVTDGGEVGVDDDVDGAEDGDCDGSEAEIRDIDNSDGDVMIVDDEESVVDVDKMEVVSGADDDGDWGSLRDALVSRGREVEGVTMVVRDVDVLDPAVVVDVERGT